MRTENAESGGAGDPPSKRARGRRTVLVLMVLFVALAIASVPFLRPVILERWHLSRLHSEDPAVRQQALEMLVELESAAGVAALVEIIASTPDASVEIDATRGRKQLRASFVDPRDWDSGAPMPWGRECVEAVEGLGPKAVPGLRRALRAGGPTARLWVGYFLGRLGPAAGTSMPDLERLLLEPSTASLAAQILAFVGWAEPALVRKLAATLASADMPTDSRTATVECIGLLGLQAAMERNAASAQPAAALASRLSDAAQATVRESLRSLLPLLARGDATAFGLSRQILGCVVGVQGGVRMLDEVDDGLALAIEEDLCELARGPDAALRSGAVQSLVFLVAEPRLEWRKAIPELVRALPDEELGESAALVLLSRGLRPGSEPLLPGLLEAAAHPERGGGRLASRIILDNPSSLGADALPMFAGTLKELLRSPEDGMRFHAAGLLCEIDGEVRTAWDALVDLARRPDSIVQADAALTLAFFGGRSAIGVEEIIALLGSEEPRLRVAGAEALAYRQEGGAPAVQALLAAVDDAVPEVQAQALRSLASIVDALPEELPGKVLRVLGRTQSQEVRLAGIGAVAHLGSEDVVAFLDRYRDDPDPAVCEGARRAREMLEPSPAEAPPPGESEPSEDMDPTEGQAPAGGGTRDPELDR